MGMGDFFKIAILIIAVCNTANGQTFTKLSENELAKQVIFTGLVLVDNQQTKNAIENENFRELNIFLGENPSKPEVDMYTVAVIALHSLAVWWMPQRYRKSFQTFSLGVQSHTVWINYRVTY